jgi:hypothetical protein
MKPTPYVGNNFQHVKPHKLMQLSKENSKKKKKKKKEKKRKPRHRKLRIV